jgi:TetR/AcrR family transcriptional regulator, transcriptional repressor for nem operon
MPRAKEFDREDVLRKAMLVFRDKGYEATSVQDLVERMEINRFSLYETFKSKHDLFVEALQAYYETVAIPFFNRLKESKEGLKVIESSLMELGSRIRSGRSPNGCLLCNTMAELGAKQDERMKTILAGYLKTLEGNFYAAVLRAKELGEISEGADAREYAKLLVGYSTGLLSLAKVLSEGEMRKSVQAVVAALR